MIALYVGDSKHGSARVEAAVLLPIQLEENVRRELGKELAGRVCLFQKASNPAEGPKGGAASGANTHFPSQETAETPHL